MQDSFPSVSTLCAGRIGIISAASMDPTVTAGPHLSVTRIAFGLRRTVVDVTIMGNGIVFRHNIGFAFPSQYRTMRIPCGGLRPSLLCRAAGR